jgi:hypothetical protein
MSKGVVDTIAGAGILATGIALDVVTAGAATPFEMSLMTTGAGMLLSGIGTLIGQRARGVAEMSRNPIQPYNIIYGRTKVGGTMIFREFTASNNRIMTLINILACHPCQEIEQLWFDNKQVLIFENQPFSDQSNPNGFWGNISAPQAVLNITSISRSNNVVYVTFASNPVGVLNDFDGQTIAVRDTIDAAGGNSFNGFWPVVQTGPNSFTYSNGGPQGPGQPNTGSIKTNWPDYGLSNVVAGKYLGNQTEASGILLGNTNGYWTPDCTVSGMTYGALKLTFDSVKFVTGVPSMSWIVQGKNSIFDPRTGSFGYTNNAALCIADYLSNPTWGFGLQYGTQILTPQLIAAANLCDEQVPLATGGTESRYTCNGTFDVSTKRGEVLQNLLTSCGGRLSVTGGQYVIQPAGWVDPTSTISMSGLTVPSSTQNMIMSTAGLVTNSYNDQEGRGEYFPGTAGTSEGQFLMCLGMLEAYAATGNQTALSIAKQTLSPMLSVLYRNYPIPETVTQTDIFAPHWLFNVKAPITSSVVRYDDVFTFTNGQCVLPDTHGQVRYVFQAITPGYTLVYQSPFSPPSNSTIPTRFASVWQFAYFLQTNAPAPGTFFPQGTPGNVVTVYYGDQTVGAQEDANLVSQFNAGKPTYVYTSFTGAAQTQGPYVVQVTSIGLSQPPGQPHQFWYFTYEVPNTAFTYFQGSGNEGFTASFTVLPAGFGISYPIASSVFDAAQNGTVVTLVDTSISGELAVIYSCLSGPITATGQDFEAFPDWRPLAAGEIDSANDTYNWAFRAFTAASVTGDSTWERCANATKQQAQVAYTVNNQRQWIAPSLQLQPLSQSGAFTFTDNTPAPLLSCNQSGSIVISCVQQPTSGTTTQFGVASINDTFAAGDMVTWTFSTTSSAGGTCQIELYIDTTDQQPFSAANRYIFTMTANLGESHVLPLTLGDFTNGTQTLPAGSTVFTCGVQLPGMMTQGISVTISSVTTTPNIPVRYEGGCIPFTANFLGNPASIIGWQGPSYVGYQSPWMFKQLGDESAVATNVQFLADAQAAWTAQAATKDIGPFAPVFYFQKPDSVQYGPENTFGFAGPDPNTGWVGYQMRPLAEIAELVAACNGSEPYYAQAVTVTNNYLNWLDANWPSTDITNGPPSAFPQTGAQLAGPEPHAVALIIRAVLKMDQAARPNGNASGSMNAAYASLLDKAMTFWGFWYQTTGVMAGTFCSDTVNQVWFGFWTGEILRTLSDLCNWAESPNINQGPTALQAITWINGLVEWVSANTVEVNSDLGYTLADINGSQKWGRLAKRDLYNGIMGTFIAESNQFQISDFPYYAQDNIHGYTNGAAQFQGDLNFQTDGARLWKNIQLPFTSSCPMAQRLAKIEMLRGRQQWRGTIQGQLSLYQSVPLDTTYLSLPQMGWANKIFEVQNSRFVVSADQGAPTLGVELDLQETDPTIYDWSTSEELNIQGYPLVGAVVAAPPAASDTETIAVSGQALATRTSGFIVSINGNTISATNPNIGVAD